MGRSVAWQSEGSIATVVLSSRRADSIINIRRERDLCLLRDLTREEESTFSKNSRHIYFACGRTIRQRQRPYPKSWAETPWMLAAQNPQETYMPMARARRPRRARPMTTTLCSDWTEKLSNLCRTPISRDSCLAPGDKPRLRHTLTNSMRPRARRRNAQRSGSSVWRTPTIFSRIQRSAESTISGANRWRLQQSQGVFPVSIRFFAGGGGGHVRKMETKMRICSDRLVLAGENTAGEGSERSSSDIFSPVRRGNGGPRSATFWRSALGWAWREWQFCRGGHFCDRRADMQRLRTGRILFTGSGGFCCLI